MDFFGDPFIHTDQIFIMIRPSPFPFLVYRRMRFLILGRSDWKKKKNHKKSRNSRPGYARKTLKVNVHIFGLTKCTIYWEKCSCFCSCFSLCWLTMLIVQIKRIISSEKWCNYVVTFFFFFFLKMPKIWVGRTTVNGGKKENVIHQFIPVLFKMKYTTIIHQSGGG